MQKNVYSATNLEESDKQMSFPFGISSDCQITTNADSTEYFCEFSNSAADYLAKYEMWNY